ncbi:MAG: hypothetical protein IJW18_09695 [Lachnospiraceae bacterium]|nr:hypothetical protein [Lachnospiraceae bacterium]
MRRKSEKGIITLEACIFLVLFMMIMLFLTSFFKFFMAQNATAHAALQASESLSFDPYLTSKTADKLSEVEDVGSIVMNLAVKLFGSANKSPGFVSENSWYDEAKVKEGATEEEITKAKDEKKTELANTIRLRFMGYLVGDADEEKADAYLENLNVVDGIDGIDFSESYIENDTLYIVLKYQLKFDFNLGNIGVVDVEQTTCSKLWK